MGDLKKYKVGIVLFFDAEDQDHALDQFYDALNVDRHNPVIGWVNVLEETTEGYPRD